VVVLRHSLALSSNLVHSDQKAMGRQSSPVSTSYSPARRFSSPNHPPSSFPPRSSCRRSPRNLAPWQGLDPISQPDEIGRAGVVTSARRRQIGLGALKEQRTPPSKARRRTPTTPPPLPPLLDLWDLPVNLGSRSRLKRRSPRRRAFAWTSPDGRRRVTE
jgi:hypothetical protein